MEDGRMKREEKRDESDCMAEYGYEEKKRIDVCSFDHHSELKRRWV